MDVQQAKSVFRGPMISVATPLTLDYELDLEALRSNIRFMVDRGVRNGQGVLLVAAGRGRIPHAQHGRAQGGHARQRGGGPR
jgi:hypothetical protein